ncbi:MAG: YidC/Oxa1 family membrane protein insertase [Clostridia bacterium]
MGTINFLSAMLCEVGKPELTNLIGKFIQVLYDAIGSFGWTVIVFTIILKVALSPLDVWQKVSGRKQSKAMERIQPQIQKLQKQYANRPDILRVKQGELMKKEKFSYFSSCLPMIITMVVFFVIFSGFNAMVKYNNEMNVYNMYLLYNQNIALVESGAMTQDALNTLLATNYRVEPFLWIDNIFMSDSWVNVVPTFEEFTKSGLGGLNGDMPDGINIPNPYETLIQPAMNLYNKTKFWNIGKWNGYMILPILSVVVTIFSTKLMQATTPQASMMSAGGNDQQQKSQQASMKVMTYMMPVMIGVFALFYSAAFTLYLFVSNLISTVFNLIFNLVAKKKDAKEKDEILSNTFRR